MKKYTKKGILWIFTIAILVLMQMSVFAEDTSNPAEEQIQYAVTKEKGTRHILPGEDTFITYNIPSDAVLTSSDTKVIQVANSGLMHAKKSGTATVTMTSDLNKTKYVVKVQVIAEVDLIIFAGQSNMCGSGGSKALAPTPASGTAYEFDVATKAKKCLPMKEPFGQGANRKQGFDDTKVYSTSGTLASAFCIAYYKQTKTPVVGVPAAWGGSSTNTWLNRGLVKETQSRVKLAKKYLKKKGIKIRHIYMLWYQGESDGMKGLSEEQYKTNMKGIYRKMKTVGVENIMVIRIGKDANAPWNGEEIMKAQENLCKSDKHFTLVSTKAKTFYDKYRYYYADTIHMNQIALNQIGTEAGNNAGKYAKKHSKKTK